MHADGDWQAVVEGVPSNDMATIGEYLQTWKLRLSTTKTVSAAFHINKEAKCKLKVNFNNVTQPFCSEPKYLRVALDRLLTYCRHLESLCKKLTSRVALLRQLAGSGWGWSNNSANSHPSPGFFNRRVLHPCLVLQCSYLPYQARHQ